MKKLWDKLANKNSRYYINSDYGKGITEEQFRESGKRDVIKYINDDPYLNQAMIITFDDPTILEIGCGTGRMTEFMAFFFKKVIGIDISGEMIKQARERLKGRDDIELIETDGETIPLKDNSIDIVFSYLVFQHMKTKEMVDKNFEEVYRVLKPKGLFKVRLRTDKLKNLDIWWGGVCYTDHEIIKLYSKFGFSLLNYEYVGDYGIWLWLKK
jgi:ubiquinone/menaquinone biosynthesis C-methylase UbiE